MGGEPGNGKTRQERTVLKSPKDRIIYLVKKPIEDFKQESHMVRFL